MTSLPDQAEIHRKCTSVDSKDRLEAASLLDAHFSNLPDKDEAWTDLIRLTLDEDYSVRDVAAYALGAVFIHVPDKDQAWMDLHRLTQVEDGYVRMSAADSLGSAFVYVPDKDQAWKDLVRLSQDKDRDVRLRAAKAMGSAFVHVPDKDEAWTDLIRLTLDEDYSVRGVAAYALGAVFIHVPDKDQTWKDLQRMTQDEYHNVRMSATYALGSAFVHIPDKDQAWMDLHRLTQVEDGYVRMSAADSLGSAFVYVPDKDQAWKDLHRLTEDEDDSVRGMAADSLGLAFVHVPDKDQAWTDLLRLTEDEDGLVRMYANYSLGRSSIFKATQARDNGSLKGELEAAVIYFEKSSHEADFSPARFCHPFYRAYLAITFQEAKKDEIQRYLAEAKEAVGSSKGKDELLKAVENLAEALREAQSLKDRPFQEVVSKLNSYRLHCEKAAEYMDSAEDEAPGAVKLMRKCNPLLDDRIQSIIAEIQEKARLISPEIERAARCLSLDDPIKAHQCCIRMASALRDSIPRLPKEKRELICGILKDIEKGGDLSVLLGKLELAMAYTLPAIEAERKMILDRLRNIQFSISNLNISSGSARKDLYELKTSVRSVQDKMVAQELNMEDLGKVLKERDHAMIERLEKMRDDWLESVEKMAQDLLSCDDRDELLMEIRSLKQSRRRDILGVTGDISSIAGLFSSLIGLAAL
jgi:HEAT repeat protein